MYQIHKDLKPLATKIDKCKLDPKNARVGHDVKGIAASLKKYGQRKPVIVNKKSNIIIAGNGTWTAAKQLGWKNIAALFVEESEEASIGFAIADNRLADKSVFDAVALHELLDIVSPGDLKTASASDLKTVSASDIPGVDDKFLSDIGYIEDDQGKDKPEPKKGPKNKNSGQQLCCPECGHKWNVKLKIKQQQETD